MKQSTRYISNKGFDPNPYLLLAGKRVEHRDSDKLEAGLRRMGLRPAKYVEPNPDLRPAGWSLGWRVHFGKISALVGMAADGRAQSIHAAFDDAIQSCPIETGNESPLWIYCCPDAEGAEQDPVAQARELFKLAVLLIDMCAASHFYWSPASLWSKAEIFRAAVAEMLESGMPPVLHLVAFPGDASDGSVNSRGLEHFCGQELFLGPQDQLSPVECIRRLARLALDMMLNGPIAAPRRFPGLLKGETLSLEPYQTNRSSDESWQKVTVRIEMA